MTNKKREMGGGSVVVGTSSNSNNSSNGSSKVKSGRPSRFSLRNILTSTSFLAGPGATYNNNETLQLAQQAAVNKRLLNDPELGIHVETSSNGSEGESNGGEALLLANGLYECPLCYGPVPSFPTLSICSHKACVECWREYLRISITESRTNISCYHCSKLLHPTDIKELLGEERGELMSKYEEFSIRRLLATEPDARWCPSPDCGFAIIAAGCASCPRLLCERPGCSTAFCYHCKQLWHPNLTCDAARERRTEAESLYLPPFSLNSTTKLNESGSSGSGKEEIKPCPKCQVLIVKINDGSCNHMSCSVCGAEFCWLCKKEISDLHYLSPSGCTFWGTKPWSRKKKLMWQLGTLVGAPVGIGLLAGIAVPAMIIGIPVWVGRKIYNKMKISSRSKRNMAVTSGVLGAVLISPVLAGLAVGLGVPILLAYVYGVVPISLCRSGGCGLSASPSGVKLEFNEGEEGESYEPSSVIEHKRGGGGARVSLRSNDFGSSRGGGASIGESSVVSFVEGVRGSSPDRESASIQALAGASLTGSLASSSHPPSQHKLEIQADVNCVGGNSSNKEKRHSLSSETASVCLSFDDGGASTRGLAGSVLSYKAHLEQDSKSERSSLSQHSVIS